MTVVGSGAPRPNPSPANMSRSGPALRSPTAPIHPLGRPTGSRAEGRRDAAGHPRQPVRRRRPRGRRPRPRSAHGRDCPPGGLPENVRVGTTGRRRLLWGAREGLPEAVRHPDGEGAGGGAMRGGGGARPATRLAARTNPSTSRRDHLGRHRATGVGDARGTPPRPTRNPSRGEGWAWSNPPPANTSRGEAPRPGVAPGASRSRGRGLPRDTRSGSPCSASEIGKLLLRPRDQQQVERHTNQHVRTNAVARRRRGSTQEGHPGVA